MSPDDKPEYFLNVVAIVRKSVGGNGRCWIFHQVRPGISGEDLRQNLIETGVINMQV